MCRLLNSIAPFLISFAVGVIFVPHAAKEDQSSESAIRQTTAEYRMVTERSNCVADSEFYSKPIRDLKFEIKNLQRKYNSTEKKLKTAIRNRDVETSVELDFNLYVIDRSIRELEKQLEFPIERPIYRAVCDN